MSGLPVWLGASGLAAVLGLKVLFWRPAEDHAVGSRRGRGRGHPTLYDDGDRHRDQRFGEKAF